MLIEDKIIGILFFSLTLIPILYVLVSKNGMDLSTKENYYKEYILDQEQLLGIKHKFSLI
jgi:hypothetical protein